MYLVVKADLYSSFIIKSKQVVHEYNIYSDSVPVFYVVYTIIYISYYYVQLVRMCLSASQFSTKIKGDILYESYYQRRYLVRILMNIIQDCRATFQVSSTCTVCVVIGLNLHIDVSDSALRVKIKLCTDMYTQGNPGLVSSVVVTTLQQLPYHLEHALMYTTTFIWSDLIHLSSHLWSFISKTSL